MDDKKTIIGIDLDQVNEDRPSVLVVEDDPDTTYLLKQVIRKGGYDVLSAENGKEALVKFQEHQPSVILLDLMMPNMDGWETLDHLRRISNVPVIILSALNGKDEILRGFRGGVDDYVSKPFHNEEVLARINAVLRRVETKKELTRLVFPKVNLLIDRVNQEVFIDEKKVTLTSKEFNILLILAKAAPGVVTYSAIANEIWGEDNDDTYKRIKYIVYLVRKKLDDAAPDNNLILNADRLGYKLRIE